MATVLFLVIQEIGTERLSGFLEAMLTFDVFVLFVLYHHIKTLENPSR